MSPFPSAASMQKPRPQLANVRASASVRLYVQFGNGDIKRMHLKLYVKGKYQSLCNIHAFHQCIYTVLAVSGSCRLALISSVDYLTVFKYSPLVYTDRK